MFTAEKPRATAAIVVIERRAFRVKFRNASEIQFKTQEIQDVGIFNAPFALSQGSFLDDSGKIVD